MSYAFVSPRTLNFHPPETRRGSLFSFDFSTRPYGVLIDVLFIAPVIIIRVLRRPSTRVIDPSHWNFNFLHLGYPILSHFLAPPKQTTQGGFNLGGTNATGQVAAFPTNFELVDLDTPQDVYTKKSYETGEEMVLVFSDEFETDGRTFFPGDDPFWEAVDLHYWGTVRNLFLSDIGVVSELSLHKERS